MNKPATKRAASDVPDIRADDPERAMEHFTAGLKRVLSARKHIEKPAKIKRRRP